MKKNDKEEFGAFLFFETRFYNGLESDDITRNRYLHTMRHLYRANFTLNAPKSFHFIKNIKVIWNHSPLRCLINEKQEKDCPLHWVPKSFGYLSHYRIGIDYPKNCTSNEQKSCAIYDNNITKFNQLLETNVKKSLNEIFR